MINARNDSTNIEIEFFIALFTLIKITLEVTFDY
jgi:hypothetical protein